MAHSRTQYVFSEREYMSNEEKILSSGRAFQLKQKTLFARIKRLRLNPTLAELKFQSKLDALGIRYIFQKGFIQGNGYYIVDFYIPKPYKIVIEIDGSSHDDREEYDKRKNAYLKKRGFWVVRITNDCADWIPLEEVREIFKHLNK